MTKFRPICMQFEYSRLDIREQRRVRHMILFQLQRSNSLLNLFTATFRLQQLPRTNSTYIKTRNAASRHRLIFLHAWHICCAESLDGNRSGFVLSCEYRFSSTTQRTLGLHHSSSTTLPRLSLAREILIYSSLILL
jgi:hypothetical protein